MRNLFGYLSVSVLSAFVGFLAIPLSTRLFDQQLLGQLNLLVSIALVAYVVMLLGMDQGYIRFYYEQEGESTRKSLLAHSLCLPMVMSLAFFAVLITCRDWLGSYLNGDPTLVALSLGLLVIALVLLRFAICFCRVTNWLALFGVFTIINVLFSKCIYLFNVGEKTLSATLAVITLVSAVAIAVCLSFLIGRNFDGDIPKRRSVSFKKLLCYSFPLMPAMLLSTVNANIPLFFVRSILDFSAVGLFSMAVTVSSVINVIGSGVNSFWPTYVFENYKTKQHAIQLFHQALTFCLLVFASVLIAVRPIIPVFLGEGYESSGDLFAILLISPLCYVIGETAGIGIHVEKKSHLYLAIYSTGLIINIVLCFLLTRSFGVAGAAASVSLTAIAMLLIKAMVGNRFYNSTGSVRWLISAITLVSAQAITCQMTTDYLATVVVSLACIGLFPLFVGMPAFKRSSREVVKKICLAMEERRAGR